MLNKTPHRVIDVNSNRGLTLDAIDTVDAMNTIILKFHGYLAARNAEFRSDGDTLMAKGNGFFYAAYPVESPNIVISAAGDPVCTN